MTNTKANTKTPNPIIKTIKNSLIYRLPSLPNESSESLDGSDWPETQDVYDSLLKAYDLPDLPNIESQSTSDISNQIKRTIDDASDGDAIKALYAKLFVETARSLSIPEYILLQSIIFLEYNWVSLPETPTDLGGGLTTQNAPVELDLNIISKLLQIKQDALCKLIVSMITKIPLLKTIINDNILTEAISLHTSLKLEEAENAENAENVEEEDISNNKVAEKYSMIQTLLIRGRLIKNFTGLCKTASELKYIKNA